MSDKITPYIYPVVAEYFQVPFYADYDIAGIHICFFYLDNNILHNLYVSNISIEGKQIEILKSYTHCGKEPLSSKAAASSLNVCTDNFCFEYHHGIVFAMVFP